MPVHIINEIFFYCRKAVEKANTLLKIKHGIVRLDNVWGVGGGLRPVKVLTKKVIHTIDCWDYIVESSSSFQVLCHYSQANVDLKQLMEIVVLLLLEKLKNAERQL